MLRFFKVYALPLSRPSAKLVKFRKTLKSKQLLAIFPQDPACCAPIKIAHLVGKATCGLPCTLLALLVLVAPSIFVLRLIEMLIFRASPGSTMQLVLLIVRILVLLGVFGIIFELKPSYWTLPAIGFLVASSVIATSLWPQYSAVWFLFTVLFTLDFFQLHRAREIAGIATLFVWFLAVAAVDVTLFLLIFSISGLSLSLFILT